MTITVKLENVHEVAQQLLSLLGNAKVVAFDGELGSGKTTLIKALCECIGCVDVVNSPTFSIINEYFTKDGRAIYHFDFYRLKNLREALDIGVEEYFYSGNFCFIEWSQLVKSVLPEDHIHIGIEKGDANAHDTRILTIELPDE